MSVKIPRINSALSGVRFEEINGFRGQEEWGRWTLGKVSQVEIRAEQPMWAEVRLKLRLPVPQQTATVSLNGQDLAQVSNSQQSATYNLRLALQLKAGDNFLRLVTNRSNLDPSFKPFAPEDRSDIALSILDFNFDKIQAFEDKSSGTVYNTLDLNNSKTYVGAVSQEVHLFTHLSGKQILDYRLLSTHDWQTFKIRLDGQTLLQTNSHRRGTLITGQLPLQLKDQIQVVTIIAQGSETQTDILHDSVRGLEKDNGYSPFYIQELRFLHPQPWQVWQQPLAIVGVLLCLFILTIWLLRRQ